MSMVRSALIAVAATLAVMGAALTPLAAAGDHHHAREHQGGYAGHAGHGHHLRRSEARRQRSEARRSRSEARRREARSEVRIAEEERGATNRHARTEARRRHARGLHHRHRPKTGDEAKSKSQENKSQEEKSQEEKSHEKTGQKPGGQQSGAEHGKPTAADKPTDRPAEAGNWSVREWLKATENWARKNREKWDDCQKQAKEQNLTGLKSRTFLATCMTSST